jgi:cystathionine gamma-synthase
LHKYVFFVISIAHIQQIRAMHNIFGAVIDPFAAYLVLRGIKTLKLRVDQQNETGLKLARFLENHPMIERVHYPGLESHADHSFAKEVMQGFGGVVSFQVKGNLHRTSRFIDGLSLPFIAPSLGGVESLVEQPTIISYWDQSPAERSRIGIADNLVRFSCGIEDAEDIIHDVEQSLNQLSKYSPDDETYLRIS